jgi:hypothetical protein
MASRASQSQPGKPWLPTTVVGSVGSDCVMMTVLSGRPPVLATIAAIVTSAARPDSIEAGPDLVPRIAEAHQEAR